MIGKRKLSFKFLAAVCGGAILLCSGSAFAQDVSAGVSESVTQEKNVFGLGIGAVPEYEGSDNYEAVPLIQAKYNFDNGMYVSFFGNSLRANLMPDKTWNIGPLVRYRRGRDHVKNNLTDSLKNIDAAVEAGAFVAYKPGKWIFQVSGVHDISDTYDGYLIDLSAGYTFILDPNAILLVMAQGTYADDDYMDTYFSVPGRYKADGAIKDVGGTVALQLNLDEHWGLLLGIKYANLLDEAKDSPVVDDGGSQAQFLSGLVVNYRF